MQQKDTYTGRFSKPEAPKTQEKEPATALKAPHADAPRKPSGFSAAGKAARPAAKAEAPESKKAKKARLKKEKKAQKENAARKRGEKKPLLKRLLMAGGVVLLIALLLIVIFGNHGTYHMMPTITREEVQPSFEPEKTPMPGVQEAI